MDELQAIERFLIENIPKKIFEDYLEEKNNIFYGPFSKLILDCQKMNKKLEKQIQLAKQERELSCNDYFNHEIYLMCKKFNPQVQISKSLEIAVQKLFTIIKEKESNFREDIQKLRESSNSYQERICIMKPKTKPKKPNKESSLKEELASKSRDIDNLLSEIQRIESDNSDLIEKIDSKNDIIGKLEQQQTQKLSSLHRLQSIKDSLQEHHRQLTAEIAKLKINQRYRGMKTLNINEIDIKELIRIRSSIQSLTGQNLELKKLRKKNKILLLSTQRIKNWDMKIPLFSN